MTSSAAQVDQHLRRGVPVWWQRGEGGRSELHLDDRELRFLERQPREPTRRGALELRIPLSGVKGEETEGGAKRDVTHFASRELGEYE
jgi:hypothetical protein